MNREFIDKMKEAKKIEAEAFRMILPENVRGHVEVIEKELRAIIMEGFADCVMSSCEDGKDCNTQKSRVHKVEID